MRILFGYTPQRCPGTPRPVGAKGGAVGSVIPISREPHQIVPPQRCPGAPLFIPTSREPVGAEHPRNEKK